MSNAVIKDNDNDSFYKNNVYNEISYVCIMMYRLIFVTCTILYIYIVYNFVCSEHIG